jgi:hypothetical protein
MVVFHFTNTTRLPWILQSGELRPGTSRPPPPNYVGPPHYRIGGYPPPDLLWATADDRGWDCLIPATYSNYRSGQTRMVRFTLQAEDFEPWRDITRRFPAWTTEQIVRLERSAQSPSAVFGGRTKALLWCYRTKPLERNRWVAIATRGILDVDWKPFSLDAAVISGPEGILGLKIDVELLFSRRIDSDDYVTVGGALEFCQTGSNAIVLTSPMGASLQSDD